jgi:hypothetical protein
MSQERTLHGDEVGDLLMSLIHTCQVYGANSFEYLTELQRYTRELAADSCGVDAVELSRDAGARTPSVSYHGLIVWPKRIVAGQRGRHPTMVGKKCLPENKIGLGFWSAHGNRRNLFRASGYARVSKNDR